MMHLPYRVVLLMVLSFLFGSSLLLAAPPEDDIDPAGSPRRTSTKELKIYVWCDAEGWHVKSPGTPAGSATHRLHGSARIIGGKVTKVGEGDSMDPGKKRVRDVGSVNPARDLVTFTFQIMRSVDTFSFQVDKAAKEVVFDLRIDGTKQLDKVVIGRTETHPKKNPFTLPAHPVTARSSEP